MVTALSGSSRLSAVQCCIAIIAALVLGSASTSVADASDADRIARILAPTTDFTKAEKYEAMQGGATTSRRRVDANAFSHPSHNLKGEGRLQFFVGNGIFKKIWVQAPSSTQASDGLGPLYNARSCQRCHLKDGRGHAPNGNHPEDSAVSMFLRLSVPASNNAQRESLRLGQVKVIPEPTYGGQLQDFGVSGHAPEGRMHITYAERKETLSDGTVVNLRVPTYSVTDLGYGPMSSDVMISPRVANQMIGLGLLEAIDEADILVREDPNDEDNDGISGRANRVWDVEAEEVRLGRFGWKAGNPSLRQQSAEAFAGDIGISNPLFPAGYGECTPQQSECQAEISGNSPQFENVEAHETMLDLVVHYAANLAVPKRRKVGDVHVLKGKQVFYNSGCAACHTPKYLTRDDASRPEHARQLIWPYTDMLLHDMGEGLADNRPEGAANGREWRTPPLWGIGLTQKVNGHTQFLHDGRARSLLEAILWHGGEAEASRETVRALSTEDRKALIAFLESL